MTLVFDSVIDLSESITFSTDKKTVNIKIHKNAKWHDGVPISSDDIIFTLLSIEDPNIRSPFYSTWQGIRTKRISEKEMSFILESPYAFFEDNLRNLYPLPKHIYGNSPINEWRNPPLSLEPVGSGPYKFLSFEKKYDKFISGYRLIKNEDYFKNIFIPDVRFYFYGNEEDMVRAYNRGEINALYTIAPYLLPTIKKDYKLYSYNLPRYYALFFNDTRNSNLKNLTVRKIIEEALPYKKILKNSLDSYGTIYPESYFLSFANTDTKNLELTSRSIEELNAALDKAGYKRKDNGIRFTLKLTVPSTPLLLATAATIHETLKELSISVIIESIPTKDIHEKIIEMRNYEALIFGQAYLDNADPFPFFHSLERAYPGLNLSQFSHQEADRLIENIRKNFNSETRNREIKTLETLLHAQVPAIYLYSPKLIFIADTNIKGIDSGFLKTPESRIKNIINWYTHVQITKQ